MTLYGEFTCRTVDGLELFCREYAPVAAARTVLCLPGLTRNSRDFEPLARRLAPRYRVLTPDLRGRGRSAWDSDPTRYHPGTSPGGMLAMVLAATVAPQVADHDPGIAQTLHRMHQRKADLHSVLVPDRGHVPLLDEPQVVPALDAFLERVLS